MAIGGLGTPEIAVILVVVGVGLVLPICYLTTMARTLAAVSERHRRMNPGLVWLNLIPVFSLGWHFYTVIKISESLVAEFRAKGIPDRNNGGLGLGLATSILYLACAIPGIGYLAALPTLICWILYWLKLSTYRSVLRDLS
jgi:cytochrome c biogenesis protein CcdA